MTHKILVLANGDWSSADGAEVLTVRDGVLRDLENGLTSAQLLTMTVDAMNSGLRCYRADLRYTRSDAERFTELWNARKVSTTATLTECDGYPHILISGDR